MSRRSRETTGPNVVIPTMTESNPHAAVERIAAFAAAVRPEHLTNDTRRLFKRNILDSLGCAIAALQGKPFQALREQFEEYRAPGRCTLIGGGTTSADRRRFSTPVLCATSIRSIATWRLADSVTRATTSGPFSRELSKPGHPASSSCSRSP